ncbi:TPA: hypothetical protein ACH0ZM_001084 [Streptococcus pneumoniae]
MAETIQNTDNLLDLTKITEPLIVNGRRQFKDVETVWAFNQWGGTIATINVAVLLNHEFYIMKFDAEGNPDWTVPTVEPKE